MKKRFLIVLLIILMALIAVPTAVSATNTDRVQINDGDTYGTLVEAVTAANSGDTIKLLDNVTKGSALEIGKSLVLDLNGNTLTMSDKINVSGGLTLQ